MGGVIVPGRGEILLIFICPTRQERLDALRDATATSATSDVTAVIAPDCRLHALNHFSSFTQLSYLDFSQFNQAI